MNNGIRNVLRLFWPTTTKAHIRQIELRLQQHRASARDNVAHLAGTLRDSVSSPLALMGAAGIGFALSELGSCKPCGNDTADTQAASKPRSADISAMTAVMEVLSLAATLLALLPKAETPRQDDPRTPTPV